ncbi:MAG: PASTA domain-containing protein [Planctomycetota bacterium]
MAGVTYSFAHIPEPGDDALAIANGQIGEAQLFVDVAPYEPNRALFTFRNIGPEPSSITDVYFDDGVLLQIASIIDADEGTGGDEGVDFSQHAEPDDLPGGELLWPPFITTDGFSADSDSPVRPNGIDPNESLGIIFKLDDNMQFTDVIDELATGYLRIGIKVQGFAQGTSESFVNNDVVPQQILVPDIVGMTQAEANSAIIAAGLVVGTITEDFNDTVPAGYVLSQSPVAETPVPTGSSVDFVVSLGHAPVAVPNVLNMTETQAEAALNGVGLVKGTVTTSYLCGLRLVS